MVRRFLINCFGFTLYVLPLVNEAGAGQLYDMSNFLFEPYPLQSSKNDDSLIKEDNVIRLKSLKVYAGTGEPQKAVMKLEVMGDVKEAPESGDGPVDAIFKCIKKLYPHEVNLQLYNVHAVTEGTDAQATVSVRIEENGKTTVGQAANTDTLVASADAYLNALNKLIIKRKKTAPEPMDLSGSKYIREKDGTI